MSLCLGLINACHGWKCHVDYYGVGMNGDL